MIGMPAGVRKLLVAYDVEGYSGRGNQFEVATQQRLVDVLTYAFTQAQVAPNTYELQEQGDGGLALLPTGHDVDEPRMIATFIQALESGLDHLNEDLVTRARIRLRVALDEGVVHRAAHGFAGPAVVQVCRLRDATVVRETLRGSSGNLVVVAADHLYRDVLAHSRRPVFAQASVTAKELTATAWIYPSPLSPSIARPATALPPVGRTVTPQLSETLDLDPGTW